MIKVKRVFELEEHSDGPRFLVDHLWPRGIKKRALDIADWLKDVAPSDELRKWFGHDPAKWEEFQRRYFAELDQKPQALEPLFETPEPFTLLYSARDTEHNNAVALKSYLEKHHARLRGGARAVVP